jgi:hypothetical protein
MSAEVELIRWMLLFAAAVALALAIATALAAADPMSEPKLLPENIRALAKPMPAEIEQPFFPEQPPVRKLPPAEAAARLWTILDNHRAGRTQEALTEWNHVGLPDETAHWREIAIGAAYLRVSDLERAEMHLDTARQLAPDHAIVAYFTGLLRLAQGDAAGRVPDTTKNNHEWFVAYAPVNDKVFYQLLAIGELRLAIARAGEVPLDEWLIAADDRMDEEFVSPTAGDLLAALDASDFAGKAHRELFRLQLSRGELADAEFHIGRAAAAGMATLAMHQELAEMCLAQGQDADAIRVAANAVRTTCPWGGALCQRLNAITLNTARATWVW